MPYFKRLFVVGLVFVCVQLMALAEVFPPFEDVRGMASHNSYAGGKVGTVLRQLDSGVRYLEFDIYATDFSRIGDYTIGHNLPGWGVALGDGNPSSTKLGEWLGVVASWSRGHAGHSPIVVMLDLKEEICRQASFAEGNPSFLNAQLLRIFGDGLFRASDFSGRWPAVGDLRGKVIVLFSGGYETRCAYRWERALHPVVALNSSGQVVEAHEGLDGKVWYWTGRLGADGKVSWVRRGSLGKGALPGVSLGEDGQAVVSLDSEGRRVAVDGRLDGAMEIVFSKDGRRVARDGEVAPDSAKASRADAGGKFVEVFTARDGAAPEDTLCYRTASVERGRVRYEQVVFVEHQHGEPVALLEDGAAFCAAAFDPALLGWAREMHDRGRMVRFWGFNKPPKGDEGAYDVINFPATDDPYAEWYGKFCNP